MTINSIQTQEPVAPEKPPVTVQNELNKDLNKQITDQTKGAKGAQNQVVQLLGNTPPPVLTTQQIAQNQIKKGSLDIKI